MSSRCLSAAHSTMAPGTNSELCVFFISLEKGRDCSPKQFNAFSLLLIRKSRNIREEGAGQHQVCHSKCDGRVVFTVLLHYLTVFSPCLLSIVALNPVYARVAELQLHFRSTREQTSAVCFCMYECVRMCLHSYVQSDLFCTLHFVLSAMPCLTAPFGLCELSFAIQCNVVQQIVCFEYTTITTGFDSEGEKTKQVCWEYNDQNVSKILSFTPSYFCPNAENNTAVSYHSLIFLPILE